MLVGHLLTACDVLRYVCLTILQSVSVLLLLDHSHPLLSLVTSPALLPGQPLQPSCPGNLIALVVTASALLPGL